MSSEVTLRQRLQAIRGNPALSAEEKSRQCQDILMRRPANAEPVAVLVPNLEQSCSHYDKKCSLFHFDCCNVIDPCHRCHMARESCDVKPPAVSSIVCNECQTRQPPSDTCIHCAVKFSHSFCGICRIWTAVDISHCTGCGFCRVGKAEDIFHCDHCEACFSKENQSSHVCAKTKLKGELCPMCLESVHFSTKSSTILQCGHVIHSECWQSLFTQGDYRCPSCRKSLFNMQPYWNEIKQSIVLQPIPADFFPIRAGDSAHSPMGRFLVLSVTAAPAAPPSATVATAAARRAQQAGALLYSGELTDWVLAGGAPARATFLGSALRRDNTVEIMCFDCEQRQRTTFHFLGLECRACGGFNTSKM